MPGTSNLHKPRQTTSTIPGFLAGGSDMASIIHDHKWGDTSLGPIKRWPQNLRIVTSIMLQSSIPMVLLWGKDGVMLYNDAYSEFAGARHPELLGSKVLEGWPEVADFNSEVMKQGLLGKTLSYSDQRLTLYRNNTPEDVWMDLNYSPVLNEDGKPDGVLAVVVETTQRVLAEQKQKRAELKLKAEQQRLYGLFMQAPAVIAVLRGPNHIYELANPLYMKITGNRAILGKPLREVRPELAGQGIYEILDEVYSSGTPYIGNESPLMLDVKGDGNLEKRYMNFVYQPFSDEPGKTEGILIHAVDVTNQIVARQTVEEKEARFRFLAETLPLKIFVTSAKGKVTYFNPQWAEYTGVSEKDLLKDGVRHFLHPQDLPNNMESWRQALAEGKALQNEQRLRRHDGKYRRHISYARPMHDDKGNIVSWFGSMTDIEDALRSAVHKEKLELLTAGLKEQRAQLKAINNAKDDFIALSSHQLRTPATAVKQYIHMIIEGYFGPLNKKQLNNLKIAYDSNERQLRIINDLLKTAQMNSSRYLLNKQTHTISTIIQESIYELKNTYKLRKQTVIFEGKSERFKALVDHGELKLALINLLENASKYSYPESLIQVSLRKKEHQLEIEIHDDGVGIDEHNKKRIFEKFIRVDNDLSDTVTGSGLGLYWVKKIINLHHGSVKVISALGKGTSIIVCLPYE